ncbi:MAG: hypothetical protein HYX66_04695 [Ignavibacteria bacterium]|nr:hypothetical protein [Ignavibacteria bacterium]
MHFIVFAFEWLHKLNGKFNPSAHFKSIAFILVPLTSNSTPYTPLGSLVMSTSAFPGSD